MYLRRHVESLRGIDHHVFSQESLVYQRPFFGRAMESYPDGLHPLYAEQEREPVFQLFRGGGHLDKDALLFKDQALAAFGTDEPGISEIGPVVAGKAHIVHLGPVVFVDYHLV